MTTGRDDATLRRYREASAVLDERPSDSTRAEILAVAARQVNARPVAADAPRASGRRRWPLAAAATVLLSTLAVLVATRTEQEMPVFTAPTDRVEERVAAAPTPLEQKEAPSADASAGAEKGAAIAPVKRPQMDAPATLPAPAAKPDAGRTATASGATSNVAPTQEVEGKLNKSAPAVSEADEQQRAPAKPSDDRRSLQSAAEPPARAKAQGSREVETREGEARSADARRAFPGAASGVTATAPSAPAAPPAPSVAPATSPPPPVAATAPVPQPARDAGASTDSVKREQLSRERAARQDAAAPTLQGAMRDEGAPKDFERSAEAWIDHIVRLRREGRHEEADAELKRLRERYPDARVPPAALAPTGTR